jgi:tetratricopeptide (TPR) repeat protein
MGKIFEYLVLIFVVFASCKNLDKNSNVSESVHQEELKQTDYNIELPHSRFFLSDSATGIFRISEYYEDTVISIKVSDDKEIGRYHYFYAIKLMKNMKFDESIKEIKKIFKYHYDDVVCNVMIADCYRQKDMKDSALFYIQKALDLDSSSKVAKLMRRDIERCCSSTSNEDIK